MNELIKYRKQINEIDAELLALFIKRFTITENVGLYKKENDLAIFDSEREKLILANLDEKLLDNKNRKYIIAIWENLLAISKQQQKDLIEE